MSALSAKKTIVFVLVISVLWVGSPSMARAGLIGTDQLIELRATGSLPSSVAAMVARADVREQFLALGVDPGEVRARLAALSEAELRTLEERLSSLPAGAGVLEVVGIVFVVLILLEFLGVTNVFSRF